MLNNFSNQDNNKLVAWEKYSNYFDEIETFDRGGKSSNRPRTKKQVKYINTKVAYIISVARGRYSLDNGLLARTGRQLGVTKLVVGDKVEYKVGQNNLDKVNLSNNHLAEAGNLVNNNLVQIVKIFPRTTVLSRTSNDGSPIIKTMASNFNTVLILQSLDDKNYSGDFINRIISSLEGQSVRIIIGLTKCDLSDLYGVVPKVYADLTNYKIVKFSINRKPEFIPKNVTVIIGKSGVGKSSLLNKYIPGAKQKIGDVNTTTNQGRHTTSAVRAFKYEQTWIIDTPGVRSFGLL
ncbi:MAG: ribosome small subunit-dependent GTPase A [Bifidobacteriaceae bacterium]|jgi:ribosome biogenesis GTPase|nr:ribosome small subunit-dependent GTPase A [Bifidobacteriaceae bacterium]